MSETMSPKIEIKAESKEFVSSLQKNQERWKVISGQEATPKTLDVLGGQEGVDLVKSGWEKQKTGAGFDKSGEELEALGGAVNVIKLEKLSNYSQEMGIIDKTEGNIVDPEVPIIGDRNIIIYKVVSGVEWEGLSENEKKLLGDESYVELVRSGWNKQSEKEGTGALKNGEELVALTGRRGAAGIDDLVADMAKMVNYNGQLMENGTKLNELFDLRKKIEEKYNLSQEEKDILNPPKEDEDKEPEFRDDWDKDEEKPDADDLPGKTEEGDNEAGDLTGKFERYLDLVGRKTHLSEEEKTERDELIALVAANRKNYQDWFNKRSGNNSEEDGNNKKEGGGDSDLPRLDDEDSEDIEPIVEPMVGPVVEPRVEGGDSDLPRLDDEDSEDIEPVVEPVIEPKVENEDKEPKKVNKERGPKVKKEKEPREKRGFWASIKRFFTESQFSEPTIVEINRVSDNFSERLKQIVTGHDVSKFKEYKSYASLDELQSAIRSGEHKYKYVENVTKLMSEADKLEMRAEKLHDQAEAKRRKARLKRAAAETVSRNN